MGVPRRLVAVAGATAALFAGSACAIAPVPAPSVSPATAVAESATATAEVPSQALNPDVTPATIATTICVPGWTATVRPPSSYTNAVKIRQLAALGYADQNPADYEEDHRIPLELGGAPRAEVNLWPEPWPEARRKDVAENAAHRAVCAGNVSLADAQRDMWTRWGPGR